MNQQIKITIDNGITKITITENKESNDLRDNKDHRYISPEQKARDLLERMEIKGAQEFTSGELVELANLFAE